MNKLQPFQPQPMDSKWLEENISSFLPDSNKRIIDHLNHQTKNSEQALERAQTIPKEEILKSCSEYDDDKKLILENMASRSKLLMLSIFSDLKKMNLLHSMYYGNSEDTYAFGLFKKKYHLFGIDPRFQELNKFRAERKEEFNSISDTQNVLSMDSEHSLLLNCLSHVGEVAKLKESILATVRFLELSFNSDEKISSFLEQKEINQLKILDANIYYNWLSTRLFILQNKSIQIEDLVNQKVKELQKKINKIDIENEKMNTYELKPNQKELLLKDKYNFEIHQLMFIITETKRRMKEEIKPELEKMKLKYNCNRIQDPEKQNNLDNIELDKIEEEDSEKFKKQNIEIAKKELEDWEKKLVSSPALDLIFAYQQTLVSTKEIERFNQSVDLYSEDAKNKFVEFRKKLFYQFEPICTEIQSKHEIIGILFKSTIKKLEESITAKLKHKGELEDASFGFHKAYENIRQLGTEVKNESWLGFGSSSSDLSKSEWLKEHSIKAWKSQRHVFDVEIDEQKNNQSINELAKEAEARFTKSQKQVQNINSQEISIDNINNNQESSALNNNSNNNNQNN